MKQSSALLRWAFIRANVFRRLLCRKPLRMDLQARFLFSSIGIFSPLQYNIRAQFYMVKVSTTPLASLTFFFFSPFAFHSSILHLQPISSFFLFCGVNYSFIQSEKKTAMHKISACIQTTTIQLKSSSLFNQRSISAVAVFFNEIGYRGKIAIATRLILNEFFSLSFLAHQIYTKGFIPGPFVVDFETDLIFFAKRCNSLLQSLMKSDHAIYFNPPIFSRWI